MVCPRIYSTDLNSLCCNVLAESHMQSRRWWEHVPRLLTAKGTLLAMWYDRQPCAALDSIPRMR